MSDFDRLFDSVFSVAPQRSTRSPLVNIRETTESYIIDAEMPGMSEKEMDIRVENDLLILSAETEQTDEKAGEDKESFLVRERVTRSFYRSFSMPRDGDSGRIDAVYKNGILTVTVHKREDAKPRQIKIKSA